MQNLVEDVRRELTARAHETTRLSARKFFKEGIDNYGVKVPVVRLIAKQYLKTLQAAPKSTVYALCDALWHSGYYEESIIACAWSLSQQKRFEPADFEVFEAWISNYVTNWASCDTFCNHTMGEFLLKYPAFVPRLIDWTASGNRWVRRAAAVSLIVPARRGKFLDEILEIARLELEDPDDMVQKGYGWLLKSAAAVYENEVFAFVMHHKHRMPRTALRYAIEKMTAAHKKEAMS